MPSAIEISNPPALGPPMGQYHHVTRVRGGDLLFIAGMLAGNQAGEIVGAGDFMRQTGQVFANIHAALAANGGGWGNVVQFTTYLVHSQSIPLFMQWRLEHFPAMFPDGKYPPNTLVVVDRLVREEFVVEVQTVAAL